jgi:hypothetical protein
MIDVNWTIRHTRPMILFIYQQLHLIMANKLQIVLTLQITVIFCLSHISSPVFHHDYYLSVYCHTIIFLIKSRDTLELSQI